ncbi:hypothetical protein MSG28_003483 [Choristoneura fumiferana]|uniref:Uncharacterized protein n=1 Tax=Choristoneura fumiferana TaxID=7141 RepID=A0ACC0KFS5_CHOFU|nr:hypothetical protein MSG28_003483 [Choristoneura fumiferana]
MRGLRWSSQAVRAGGERRAAASRPRRGSAAATPRRTSRLHPRRAPHATPRPQQTPTNCHPNPDRDKGDIEFSTGDEDESNDDSFLNIIFYVFNM